MWSAPSSSNMIITQKVNVQSISEGQTLWNTSVKQYDGLDFVEFFYMPVMQKKSMGGNNQMQRMKEDYQDGSIERSSIRAGSRIRELILANDLRYFWTLTYADEEDRKEVVKYDFQQFMRRLRYKLRTHIPFVAVIEIQQERAEKCGKDVLHLHFVTDRYIDVNKYIEPAWQQGFVKVEKSSGDVVRVAQYLSKYVKKDIGSVERDKREHRYMVSKGLKNAHKETIVLSDDDLKYLKNKADYVKEFERGIWIKIKARSLQDNEELVYLIQDDKNIQKVVV